MAKRVGLEGASEATGLSKWELRQGSITGKYPSMRVGDSKHGRIIFDLDLLEESIRQQMLQNLKSQESEKVVEIGRLRRVAE